MAFIAVYDANVLYPSTLRDVLIRVAQAGLVQAKWTEKILDETFRNLKKNRPELDPEKLDRTQERMSGAIRDVLVKGYEPLINIIDLPDPDDRHVLAAAIKAKAQVIVTSNLKDFPSDARTRLAREFAEGLSSLAVDRAMFLVHCARQIRHAGVMSRYTAAKPFALPASLAALEGPDTGSVALPRHIDWGPRYVYELADEADLRLMYERVIREAQTPADLHTYLTEAVLRRLWRELFLPTPIRVAWEARFPDLGTRVAAA